ncbi:MAG: hypothetical protein WAM82_22025 [Thermoanaerobaculia bacterium]
MRASRGVLLAPPSRCLPGAPVSFRGLGFVLRVRNNRGDSTPFKLTTNGTIVRGPYQGDVPLELLHACYRLVK